MPELGDDGIDHELIAFLRSLKADSVELPPLPAAAPRPQDTSVLSSAEHVRDYALDVALDQQHTKDAARMIYDRMRRSGYSTKTWSTHELHPKVAVNVVEPEADAVRDHGAQAEDVNVDVGVDDDDDDAWRTLPAEEALGFVFTMDLLNFCFWSDREREEDRFAVWYRGRRWTGYRSLLAALWRARGIAITSPTFWLDTESCTDETIRYVFRSCTDEEMPLLAERMKCLREAGHEFESRFSNCVAEAGKSAVALVNLLADRFASFRDVATCRQCHDNYKYDDGGQDHRGDGGRGSGGHELRFLKRAQILVADLWACFQGRGYGKFHDIDRITMFADYRIPQMLHTLGCLLYSPSLEAHVRQLKEIPSGHPWEIELRGCSIWCVELIRRYIVKHHREQERQKAQEVHQQEKEQEQEGQQGQQEREHEQEQWRQKHPESAHNNGSNSSSSNSNSDGGTHVAAAPATDMPHVNAILIDFFLYDTVKAMEAQTAAATRGDDTPHVAMHHSVGQEIEQSAEEKAEPKTVQDAEQEAEQKAERKAKQEPGNGAEQTTETEEHCPVPSLSLSLPSPLSLPFPSPTTPTAKSTAKTTTATAATATTTTTTTSSSSLRSTRPAREAMTMTTTTTTTMIPHHRTRSIWY